MDVNGLGAIVTGGASGLGGATAARLAKAGAKVTILDRDSERGEMHAAAIGGQFLSVDVTDEAAVGSALDRAQEENGVARILVNCAGVATPGKILSREGSPLPLADFARVVSINLIGTFNLLSQFSARLHDASLANDEERGVIVNTASVAGYEGQIGQAAYAASKGGVIGLTLPAARELARYGIRVVAIAPGLFLTPMLEGLPPEAQASLGGQVPFPARLGRPEEYALMVEQIIANPMLNGEVIRLDGAIRMAPR